MEGAVTLDEARRKQILADQLVGLGGAARLRGRDRKIIEHWVDLGLLPVFDHDEDGRPRFLTSDVLAVKPPRRYRRKSSGEATQPPTAAEEMGAGQAQRTNQ
jgi:hypothetical protein